MSLPYGIMKSKTHLKFGKGASLENTHPVLEK